MQPYRHHWISNTPLVGGALMIGAVLLITLLAFGITNSPETVHVKQPRPFQSLFRLGRPRDTTSRSSGSSTIGEQYLLGAGKADITGPVVEVIFAGFADNTQVGTGLRQRLYARAFIVGDADDGKKSDRFAYVVIDTAAGDTAVRYGILEGLRALGGDYAALYGKNNVAVVGTHSHSGPGAWFNYLLPQIANNGFDRQSYQAIVNGAVLAIKRAHDGLTKGRLSVGKTRIADGNINRSLYAYLNNPAEERAKYQDNTDKDMTLLRFQRASDGRPFAVLSWFAVHPTSMLGNNTHVTGDNKGVAATMFEKDMAAAGIPDFVAGFSQANVGDTSPNVLGAWCDDGSGAQCSFENSTCADGRSQKCHGRGPLFYKLDLGKSSCYEMGRRQYAGAKTIYNTIEATGTPITGPSVKSFHMFQDMRYFKFTLENGKEVQTCPAALGYSFAAGTSDWPGRFDFTQGDSGEPNASPIWMAVRGLLKTPSPKQQACQQPKPVLLDVGEIESPYPWSPNIVDIQMFRVGQLVILVSPVEVTTMGGRRWREAVAKAAVSPGGPLETGALPVVVVAGPANAYAHYVTTPEEYDIQRYEGASTLYGRYELPAFINLTVSNLAYLRPDTAGLPPPPDGPSPPDNRDLSFSFISGVVADSTPINTEFGDVISQPRPTYRVGEVVNATFIGANPRNNLRLEKTFAAVEQKDPDEGWKRVRDDSDWFLVYTWSHTNAVLGHSEVVISWETDGDVVQPGTYRLKYYGDAKVLSAITMFEGTSAEFSLS